MKHEDKRMEAMRTAAATAKMAVLFCSDQKSSNDRALAYVNAGDLRQAFSSIVSDLGKYPDTEDSRRCIGELGIMLLMGGQLDTPDKMREFIKGVN
jgi:hypothetical protein